jgi:hypothetical protein
VSSAAAVHCPQNQTPSLRECGLTPRSSGAPTAGHQARAGGTRCIFTGPGLASCRCRPLSSNVRPQSHAVHAAQVRAWHRWSAEVMKSRGVRLQARFIAATRREMASVAHFCQPRQASDESLSLGKQLTDCQASGPRKGLTCLVGGWRFAPPRCAGQSVGRPLRPREAPARHRVFVLWRQAPSSHPLSSRTNSGSLLPLRRRGAVSVGHLSGSTVPASPLRPNPSTRTSH